MMVALLLYVYSRGLYSSRRIAQACEERVDFMAVTAMNQPDFRTIAKFRRLSFADLLGLLQRQRHNLTKVLVEPSHKPT